MSLDHLLQMADEAAGSRSVGPDDDRLITLVVDDEPALLAELTEGLTALGLDVVDASDAEAALARIRADPGIGVLLTDVKMPRISGIELLRDAMAARTEAAALEGIIITAHTSIESVTSAMRSGAIDFLAKPFGLLEAATAVKRALERCRARRRQAQALDRQRQALAAAEATAAALAERMVSSLQDDAPADAGGGAARADRARILAHELRTPLVPVLGYAELLTARDVAPDDVRHYADEIRVGALRLLSTIDRLLEFEALFRPGAAARLADGETARLFEDALAATRTEAAARGVTLVAAAGAVVRFRADFSLLRRALAELLRNAIAASPAGATVRLLAEPATQGVRLLVRDAGAGLAAAPAGPDATLHKADGALGLGLPVVRRMAELHGGTLAFSTLPDGGTEAALWLPAA